MRSRNQLLGVAYGTFILLGISASLLNIAWDYMEVTFHVTLDKLGLLLAAGTVGYLVAAFSNGRLMARLGLGRLLLVGGGLMIAGSVGYVITPVWGLLLGVAVLGSMGAGFIDAGMNTYISAFHSATAMNWLHACYGVGTMIGPALVTFYAITLELSWRLGYATLLVLDMALLAILLVTLPRWTLQKKKKNDAAAAEIETPAATILETLRAPMVVWGLLLFFLFGGIEIGTGQLANSLLVDGRGVDPATAGWWVSIYWGMFTAGRILSGLFAARVAPQSVLRGGMILAIIGAALLWWNWGGQTGFLGLAVLGFALAPMFPMLTSGTPQRVGLRHTPNTIGFQLGVCGLGGAVLPGLAAALAAHAGLEVIGPILTASAVAVLSIYTIMLRREALHREAQSIQIPS